jgi:hypothetical protein
MSLDLFIHVGLHRTGSTFVQKSLFPKIEELKYYYKPRLDQLLNLDQEGKILLSDEAFSGRIWDADRFNYYRNIYNMYPKAKIIIGFRNHLDWIQSTYSLYLRRFGTLSLEGFFSGDRTNEGLLKRQQLNFDELAKFLIDLFDQKPFIYLYDEIKTDQKKFINDLSNYMGVSFDHRQIEFSKPLNRGLNGRQQRLCKSLNRFVKSEYGNAGVISKRMASLLRYNPEKISRSFYKNQLKSDLKNVYPSSLIEEFEEDWEKLKETVLKYRT